MTNNWFECKVKYQKLSEQGLVKNVNEPYLVQAVSFSDAESRINKEMEPYISGDFSVTNIKIANYSELFPGEKGDRWFKCKVSYITIDEERGLERKSNTNMLVRASSVKEAYDNLENEMRNTVSDYVISAVQESMIMDVFPFDNSGLVIKREKPTPLQPSEDFENEDFEEVKE